MFTALLDTCVLWPSLQRDVLLSLAAEGMYRPAWSSVILAELEYEQAAKLTRRGVVPADADHRAAHLIQRMRQAFDDAEITGWEGLEGTYGLPDPDDEHVVAAAVVAVPAPSSPSTPKTSPHDPPLRFGNAPTCRVRRQHRRPRPAPRTSRHPHHRRSNRHPGAGQDRRRTARHPGPPLRV